MAPAAAWQEAPRRSTTMRMATNEKTMHKHPDTTRATSVECVANSWREHKCDVGCMCKYGTNTCSRMTHVSEMLQQSYAKGGRFTIWRETAPLTTRLHSNRSNERNQHRANTFVGDSPTSGSGRSQVCTQKPDKGCRHAHVRPCARPGRQRAVRTKAGPLSAQAMHTPHIAKST